MIAPAVAPQPLFMVDNPKYHNAGVTNAELSGIFIPILTAAAKYSADKMRLYSTGTGCGNEVLLSAMGQI